MNEESQKLVYYYLAEEKSAKKYLWSHFNLSYIKASMEECSLWCGEVPAYHIGKRMWETEKLTEVLQKELTDTGAGNYYLHPALADLLGMKKKLPPELLMQKIAMQNSCWENLCLIGEEEEADAEEQIQLFFELFEQYICRINRFSVLTSQPELYGGAADLLYEEYGIPTAFHKHMGELTQRKQKIAIADFKHSLRISGDLVPQGAVYIDFYSKQEIRDLLESKRKDVHYLSAVKFLDTVIKNGYNTLVNQTYNNYQ